MKSEWRDSDLQYDMSAGYWVRDGIEVTRKTTVVSIVAAGFDAYGRVLHPVQSFDDGGHVRWLRWADVARVTGAVAHPSMELETMLGFAPNGYFQSTPIVPESPVPPWRPQQLTALGEVLAQHTTTPGRCWFGFWEGNTAFDELPRNVPKLTVEGFRYYLLRGPSLGQQTRSTGWKLTCGGQTIEPGTWPHTSTSHAPISAAAHDVSMMCCTPTHSKRGRHQPRSRSRSTATW
ncbi:hypothetical protein [Rhodococcus koreensis]|uniref:hypothetical protein n=1 Tax=Rhodococcus koreensis TaxID=99653 RepID=UPI00366B04C1